ncbi:MAG TPA: DUF4270 family protein [Cyclobacteriaceae bacterium]|nr:DUF4270 family protein [Cyclobacteriaceae bacterium]
MKADYVDIPLYPSVVYLNTVLTQNISGELDVAGNTFSRTLIGKINDPRFGKITATTYLNFSPPLSTVTPDPTSTADSILMELALDFYQVGSTGTTTQTFEVHELLDTLNELGYYSSSTVPYSSTAIATASVSIDPDFFANAVLAKTDADTSNDQSLKLKIKLPITLGQNVLQDLITTSSAITDFNVFSGKYKGFALVPTNSDKIFGMNPIITTPYNYRQSRIVLYYSTAGVQSHADLPLYPAINSVTGLSNNVVSFTSFSTDRSGTALSGIEPYKEFKPTDGYTYVQGGSALMTRLDLRDFYKYVDTLNNVIINSAQLITNNTISQGYVNSVSLRILDSLNTFRNPYMDSLVNDVIQNDVPQYVFRNKRNELSFGDVATNPTVDVLMLGTSATPISVDTYQLDGALVTEFCQKIAGDGHYKDRIKWLAIIPNDTEFRKSVNLLVLDPTTKLRIFYSQPIIKIR